MRQIFRRRPGIRFGLEVVLGLGALAVLAACGSSGIPSDAVVQVNGQPITKETFDHWLGVAASAGASSAGGQKTAKPVIPEPPAYTACIAHLQATEPKPAKGEKAKTPTLLKTECEQQYKTYQQEVLGFLIALDLIVAGLALAALGLHARRAV